MFCLFLCLFCFLDHKHSFNIKKQTISVTLNKTKITLQEARKRQKLKGASTADHREPHTYQNC